MAPQTARETFSVGAAMAFSVFSVCFIAGMMMMLFGPALGRYLTVVAFLGNALLLFVVVRRDKRKALCSLAESRPEILRWRPLLSRAIMLCFALAAIGMVAMALSSRTSGGSDLSEPVFALRVAYELGDQSVGRTRFLIANTGIVIGLHSLSTGYWLLGLYLVLFPRYPPR